jgi:uncharacterized protein (DUF2336 family)
MMGEMQVQKALLGELERSFRHGDFVRRDDIVQKIGHLFVSGAANYSAEQVELFGEVLTRLVEQIGEAARAELARSLSTAPIGPSKLVRRLALDDSIRVAAPLLTDFGALDQDIQVDCAASCGQQHLMALTRRASLSEAVTAPLVVRGDAAVLKSVIGNPGAAFSNRSYGTLIERSIGDDELGRAIGGRADLPRHHFLRLLQVASELVRQELQAADPQNAGAIQKVVAHVAGGIADSTLADSDRYQAALDQVRKLHAAGKLDDTAVLGFVRQGRVECAIAALACLSEQEVSEVESVFRQERFEPMLILARALGLTWPTTKALLHIQAGITGLSNAQVERALAVFERTDRATAQKVLEIKRRAKRPPTRH